MKLTLRLLGLVSAILLALAPVKLAKAQTSDALVDLLVQKGVITDQEGEDIRAKMVKEWATNPASKITLSSAIKNLKFYGDVRMRFEARNGKFEKGDILPGGTGGATGVINVAGQNGNQNLDRYRFRFRMGVTADLYDHWFAGFGVATNPNNDRSGNVTFGNSDNGPFGKGASTIAINKVFIGVHATNDLTLEVGQFDNPLYTTNLTWDANLTPQGFAEMYEHKFGALTVFANAGQYIYDAPTVNGTGAFTTPTTTQPSNTLNTTSPGLTSQNVFMFDEQIGAKYNINDTTFVKGAVGFMSYSASKDTNGNVFNGAGPVGDNISGPFTGGVQGVTNTYAVNNLAVLDIPAEFDFKAWKTPFKVFGDFAINLDAQGRSSAAQNAETRALSGNAAAIAGVTNVSSGTVNVTNSNATTSTTTQAITGANNPVVNNQYMLALNRNNADQDTAYQIGIQAGELKKKNDWMVKTYWQHTGYYAVDPNLVDADIFDARVNMEGVVVQGNYNITDAITATVTYAHANPADNQLGTPGQGRDLTIDPIKEYQLVQADLMWKF